MSKRIWSLRTSAGSTRSPRLCRRKSFIRKFYEEDDSGVYIDLLQPIDLLAQRIHRTCDIPMQAIKNKLDLYHAEMAKKGFVDHGYYSAIIVLKWYGYLIQTTDGGAAALLPRDCGQRMRHSFAQLLCPHARAGVFASAAQGGEKPHRVSADVLRRDAGLEPRGVRDPRKIPYADRLSEDRNRRYAFCDFLLRGKRHHPQQVCAEQEGTVWQNTRYP